MTLARQSDRAVRQSHCTYPLPLNDKTSFFLSRWAGRPTFKTLFLTTTATGHLPSLHPSPAQAGSTCEAWGRPSPPFSPRIYFEIFVGVYFFFLSVGGGLGGLFVIVRGPNTLFSMTYTNILGGILLMISLIQTLRNIFRGVANFVPLLGQFF